MTSWFKTGLWVPKVTPKPAQKVHTKQPGALGKPAAGTAPRADTLEAGKNPSSAQILHKSGAAAGAQPARAADEQRMASQRAATFNDLLRDPHEDPAVKAETIQQLDRFPAVAAAPVEGTKLTVLEHALARLSRTRPASRKGTPEPESGEHLQTWMDTTLLVQQYTKLADGPLAAKLSPALGKATMESLKGGERGTMLTTALLQAGHMALGKQRRQSGVLAVSRSLGQGGDPVQAAEQHVQDDLEKLLGGKSNAARACKQPDVEAYRREAVAELVLAGAARRTDIPVDISCFGRDGRVADSVRNSLSDLKEVHAVTAKQRAESGDATPSATALAQEPHLNRLNDLLQLYQNRAVPDATALRQHFGSEA